MKTVSIIMPVFNIESNLIMNAVKSVLNQTLTDIELIIVNDGSTSNETLQCLADIKEKYPQIRVINQDNKGLGGARNTGIDSADSVYIGFLDPDDWIDNNFYETLYHLCIKNNSDIACGILFRIGTNKQQPIDYFNNITTDDFVKKMTYIKNGSVCSKLFKKDLFKNNFFDEHVYMEDNPVLIKAMINSKKVSFCKDVKYYYRENDNSICLNPLNTDKIRQGKIIALNKIHNILKNLKQKEKDIVYSNFITILLDKLLYKNDYDYQNSIKKILGKKYRKYLSYSKNSLLENIFSVKNSDTGIYKIITILGIKVKIRRNNMK